MAKLNIVQGHCDTTIDNIEKYVENNDNSWIEIGVNDEILNTERGERILCGSGSMGNEGFVAVTDKDNNLIWAMFCKMSNPFIKTELKDRTIYAYSSASLLFIIDIDEPYKMKIEIADKDKMATMRWW